MSNMKIHHQTMSDGTRRDPLIHLQSLDRERRETVDLLQLITRQRQQQAAMEMEER